MARLPVKKTYKLYVGGEFARSESGRSYEAEETEHLPRSRKDLRDAVRAARQAFGGWAGRTAFNRGQILYRAAEMMEARRADLADVCARAGGGRRSRRSPRLVRRLGRQARRRRSALRTRRRPVFNFTVPEPTGVVGVLCPDEPPLAGIVSRIAPAMVDGQHRRCCCRRNAPVAAIELAEVLATSDLPGGVVNILTGWQAELAPWLASHMDVNAMDVTGADGDSADLERSAAENVKRVIRGGADGQSLWDIAAFVELKTVWHPIGR